MEGLDGFSRLSVERNNVGSLSNNLYTMQTSQLVRYCQSLGENGVKVAKIFEENDIDGKVLAELTFEEIKEAVDYKITLGLKNYINDLIDKAKKSMNTPTRPSKPLFHPFHPDVQVVLTPAGGNPVIVSLDNHGQVDLSGVPDAQQYSCQFIVPKSKGYANDIVLQTVEMKKVGDHLTPDFVDLGARVIDYDFSLNDKQMSDSDIKGTLTLGTGKPINVQTKSNSKGQYSTVLPPSSFTFTVSNKEGSISHSTKVTPPPPVASLQEAELVQSFPEQVSHGSTSHNLKLTGNKVAVLSDVSGSMSSKGQMERLKRSLNQILDQYPNKQVMFMSWNTSHQWFMNGVSATSTPEMGKRCREWIQDLAAGGGNDMRQAMNAVTNNHPDVCEIITLCDGDVSPFSDKQSTEWEQYRTKYPSVNFSFVAIGADAKWQIMQEMAMIGNGSFNRVN
eukprot:gene16783-19960_t